MQLSALTVNLAAIRSELKANHEKIASVDQIKAEKAGFHFSIDCFCLYFILCFY